MPDFVIVLEPCQPEIVEVEKPGNNFTLEILSPQQGPQGAPGGASFIKIAHENLGGQRMVVLNEDDKVEYASSQNASHMHIVVGMTKTAAAQNEIVEIVNNTIVQDASWNWQAHSPVFLTTNGLMSQNINDTGIFVLSIGTALSATKIYLKQSQPIRK